MDDELAPLLAEHGLNAHEEAIRVLVRPCVQIHCHREQASGLSSTHSRFGGLPHLPTGFQWPEGMSGPMVLIAQIWLSDADAHDATGLLPSSGILYFWYDVAWQPWGFDPDDRPGFRVDFVPDEGQALELRSFPGASTRPRR